MSELCCGETAEYWHEEYEKLARAKDIIDKAKSNEIKVLESKLSDMIVSRDSWKEKLKNLHEYNKQLSELLDNTVRERNKFKAKLDEYDQTHMLLPVDADGVPIRPGDKVTDEYGVAFTVGYVAEDMVCTGTGAQILPYECHRWQKSDTIESVVEEVLINDEWRTLDDEAYTARIAEYAERIRAIHD